LQLLAICNFKVYT